MPTAVATPVAPLALLASALTAALLEDWLRSDTAPSTLAACAEARLASVVLSRSLIASAPTTLMPLASLCAGALASLSAVLALSW